MRISLLRRLRPSFRRILARWSHSSRSFSFFESRYLVCRPKFGHWFHCSVNDEFDDEECLECYTTQIMLGRFVFGKLVIDHRSPVLSKYLALIPVFCIWCIRCIYFILCISFCIALCIYLVLELVFRLYAVCICCILFMLFEVSTTVGKKQNYTLLVLELSYI